MRKLLRVHIPVAKACVIVFTLTKPPVIHHKAFDADGRSLLRESHLSLFVDRELRRLPRVVDHRPRTRIGTLGKNPGEFKAVKKTRGSANAGVRIASIEDRR